MAGGDTTYRIQVLYEAKDKASKPLEAIAGASERASRSAGGLGDTLRGVAGALAGLGALKMGKEMFIDFNASMQDMKITMTALTQANLNEPFELARKQMDLMVDDFTQFAKASPLTTKEIVDFAQGVEAGVLNAGGSLKDFKNIAEEGALAAKMLGADANYAGTEIQEMLQGSVRKNMRFARNLMGFAGVHDTDAFNKMGADKRLALVEKALNSPAMKQAGKQFEQSFTGVTSTLKDQIQLIAGGIGLPLFKQITAEVQKWNAWIEKNPDKIRQFAADFTNALADGFNAVKGIASFLVDNKDLLMSLAKAWLVGKGAGGIAGSMMGIAQGAAGGGGGAGVVMAAGMTAQLVADLVDKNQTLDIDMAAKWSTAQRGMTEYQNAHSWGAYKGRDATFAKTHGQVAADERIDRRFLSNAQESGFVVKGKINQGAIDDAARKGIFTSAEEEKYVAILEKLNTAERRLSMERERGTDIALHSGQAFLWASKNLVGYADLMGALAKSQKVGEKAYSDIVNVKIDQHNAIQVMTDDPDRFSVGLTNVALDALKNPRGARTVIREAG